MKIDAVVAVIIPMFNSVKSIERAIDSVMNQSYKNWKLYLIDDCSTDLTVELIKNKYDDDRLCIVKNDVNRGVAETRNRGISLASEKIICFLDSDDEWHMDKLDQQIKEVNKGAKLVIGSYIYKKNNEYLISYNENKLTHKQFLKKDFRVCFSSVCIDFGEGSKEYFKKIGHEDFEYLHRCMLRFKYATLVMKPVVNYYCQENSLSSNKIKAARWHFDLLAKEMNIPFIERLYLFAFYLMNAVKFSLKFR